MMKIWFLNFSKRLRILITCLIILISIKIKILLLKKSDRN